MVLIFPSECLAYKIWQKSLEKYVHITKCIRPIPPIILLKISFESRKHAQN